MKDRIPYARKVQREELGLKQHELAMLIEVARSVIARNDRNKYTLSESANHKYYSLIDLYQRHEKENPAWHLEKKTLPVLNEIEIKNLLRKIKRTIYSLENKIEKLEKTWDYKYRLETAIEVLSQNTLEPIEASNLVLRLKIKELKKYKMPNASIQYFKWKHELEMLKRQESELMNI
ncbi:MAG TPA: hypothetical protein PL185_12415 [Flavobacteriales bacterium]|nr:hypothetical protein [Flavobacteriales bacterium]